MKIVEQKGVTLIALIVAIAILIILAGVGLNAAFKKGGVLKSAQDFSNTVQQNQIQKDQETNKLIEEAEDAKNLAEEKKVAKIGSKTYKTLQSAMNAVTTDNKETTIILLKDIKENVTIQENQNIIIDLQEKIIENATSESVIAIYGKLSLKNGTISSNSDGKNAIENYGECTISGEVQIKGTANCPTVFNESGATLTVNGGTLSSENSNTINNYGDCTISGTAQIKGTDYPTVYNRNGATLTVNGGTISSTNSNTIVNSGNCTISETAQINGIAQSAPTVVNKSGATLEISGGTITATATYAVWNKSGGTATITGGTISSTNSNSIGNYGNCTISGTAQINGTAQSATTVVNESGGTLAISEGTITSINSQVIWNKSGGTLTVSGGEIVTSSTTVYAVNNYGECTVKENANIYSKNSIALCNFTGGTATITGGIINSTSSHAFWNQPNATTVVTGGNIKTASGIVFRNDGNLQISGNTNINSESDSGIWNVSGATLDIKGCIIRAGHDGILNAGTAQIEGDNTIIETLNSSYTAISTQTNSLTIIKGGIIKGNEGKAIYVPQNATIQITGGYISSANTYGILSSGAMTITGGIIENTNASNYALYNWTSNGGTCTVSGANIIGKTYGI